jgi:CBS domain-containing protein
MNIESILSTKGHDVRTIPSNMSVREAMRQMKSERIGALVVSEDGSRIAGIITDRGILWGIAEQGTEVLDQPIGVVMTRSVMTCRAEDPISAIMVLMTERRIRHVPVTDAEGRLAGIVSIGDVVKHRLDEIQLEADALREYIGAAR